MPLWYISFKGLIIQDFGTWTQMRRINLLLISLRECSVKASDKSSIYVFVNFFPKNWNFDLGKKNFIYICQNYEQPLFLYQSSRAAQNFFFYVIPSFFFCFCFFCRVGQKICLLSVGHCSLWSGSSRVLRHQIFFYLILLTWTKYLHSL